MPGLDLMERAGAGRGARRRARRARRRRWRWCAARATTAATGWSWRACCARRDVQVSVSVRRAPEDFAGDALRESASAAGSSRRCVSKARAWTEVDERQEGRARSPSAAVIVDALLGTGFEGEPRGAVAEAIEAVERARGAGRERGCAQRRGRLDGVVAGSAVTAAVTVTFHAAKPGLWIRPGKAHAGEVETIDIGIPRGAPGDARIGLIGATVLELLPRRRGGLDEVRSGHVLVVGGSRGPDGRAARWPRARACARARAMSPPACPPRCRRSSRARATPELMTRGLARRRRRAHREGRGARARGERAAAARSRSARVSAAARARSRSRAASRARRRSRWCSTPTA